jgi:hypothetical protein
MIGNKPRSSRRNKRNNNSEEIPKELKDAMREAGLNPDDPQDLQSFIDSMQKGGRGTRRRRT